MGLFGHNENEQKGFEQIIEGLKIDYANLAQDNKAKEEEIAQLKKVIETLKSSLESGETITPDEIITPEPTPQPILACPDYAPTLDAISVAIKELREQSEEIKKLVGRRDIQDENVREMHKELEKFRGNFYAKITQPYLMAMLDLHKRFFDTHAHFDHLDNSESDFAKLYENLMIEFKSAVMALENRIYNDFGVEYFEPAINEEFDPKIQQPINVIETTDPEQHRKIAQVLYGGFRDIDSGKILRPARIACYKLISPQE